MGSAKRIMEAEERKRSVATQIAIEAELLEVCAHGVATDAYGDLEDAYRLGNYKFSHGLLGDTFDDRRDMTDHIKAAVEESPDECAMCAKNAAE